MFLKMQRRRIQTLDKKKAAEAASGSKTFNFKTRILQKIADDPYRHQYHFQAHVLHV
jgi:hypothetical protein